MDVVNKHLPRFSKTDRKTNLYFYTDIPVPYAKLSKIFPASLESPIGICYNTENHPFSGRTKDKANHSGNGICLRERKHFMRADRFLHIHGLARSRSHAQALIEAGVMVDGTPIRKPSQEILDSVDPARIAILKPSRYVSRGGVKLEAALAAFRLDVAGRTALDLGASTGGFTDCLLQHGAACVIAVDVGHGQLAPSLKEDPRVISMEGVNARTLTGEELGAECSLAVCDLSFISQALIYPAVARVLPKGGALITLIKPQFEAGRDKLCKNGVVRDRKVHAAVISSLFSAAKKYGLFPQSLIPSPIAGGDGNREYLALFRVGEEISLPAGAIEKAVAAPEKPNSKMPIDISGGK